MNKISTNDTIKFHTIVDVLNTCFGKKYQCWRKATYVFNDSNFAWFPKLAVLEGGKYVAQDKKYGCVNILFEDGNRIKESHSTADGEPEYCLRFVFAKPSPNEDYKFIGAFKKNMTLSEKSFSIYDKVSDEVDLTKYT